MIAEFAYNNARNASTNYMLFELNCGFHSQVFYKEDLNSRSKLKAVNEIIIKLKELTIVYKKNLRYA